MIRDRLRRLLGRERAAPPSVAPARPPAPPPEEIEVQLEIEGDELKRKVDSGLEPLFVDIREPYEVAGGHVAGALIIPMNQVPARLAEIPRDRTLIVYCAAGVRSYGVTHWLREQGYADTWSLVGGIYAWIDQGGELVTPAR